MYAHKMLIYALMMLIYAFFRLMQHLHILDESLMPCSVALSHVHAHPGNHIADP